jgi:hypothetical protein
MNIWGRIRQMSFGQLFRLGILFLKHPLLILPTLRASRKTFEICNRRFGLSHHGHGIENAFRHALWNILICQNSIKMTKNRQKSVIWAKKVTDLYEKVTKTDLLNRSMDLHNNAIGRKLFLESNSADLEQKLVEMMRNGRIIDQNMQFSSFGKELVYIA